jgi:U3 small nucleolar RNA-associated protein 19
VVFQAVKSGQRIFNHYQSINEFSHHGVSSNNTSVRKLNKRKEESKDEALADDPKHQVRVWLRKRYFEFCSRLIELLYHEEPGLQLPALEALMQFEKSAAQSLAGGEGELPKFVNVFLPYVVAVLVHNRENREELWTEFKKKYLTVFDDVRLFLLKSVTLLIQTYDPKKTPEHGEYYGKKPYELKISKRIPYLTDKDDELKESIFEILISINMASKPEDLNNFLVQLNEDKDGDHKSKRENPKKRKREPTEDDMDSEDGFDEDFDMDIDDDEEPAPLVDPKLLDINAHKSAFSKTWLAFMSQKLDTKLHIQVLQALEKQILPFMLAPVTLYDYLSHCYQTGGVIGMLSLGGLFILLRKFNVEYPDFFPHLYSMITQATFFVKQRKRFFELTSLFLEGATLPLYMICAFLKRFSRLSLVASPQASLLMISMVYRILIKHPAAQVLLHRTHNYTLSENGNNEATSQAPLILTTRLDPLANDPYNMDETDPSKCRAIESSLWEMKLLANHAVPAVATLAQLLFGSPELKMISVNVGDFIDQSYQSLFDTEHKRKTKNAALNFQLPKRLFDKQLFSSYSLNPRESMVGFQDPQLVAQVGPTSTAVFQEKKKRKSFSELKDDRKKKKVQFGNKRPRFRMK